MNARSLIVLCSLVVLVPTCAFADDEQPKTISALRSELSDLRGILAQLLERMKTLEKRLEQLEAAAPRDAYLRFPIEVERAMMGDRLRTETMRPDGTRSHDIAPRRVRPWDRKR